MNDNDTGEDIGTTCTVCGIAPADMGTWLDLEVHRTRNDTDETESWYVDFCSQGHAAEWLSRPLEPQQSFVGPRDTWLNRCLGVLLLAGVVALFLFGGLGLSTAVRFLLQLV